MADNKKLNIGNSANKVDVTINENLFVANNLKVNNKDVVVTSNANIGSPTQPVYLSNNEITLGSDKYTFWEQVQEGTTPAAPQEYVKKIGDTMTGLLISQNISPSANNTYTLGSSAMRYNNIFANTLTGNSVVANSFMGGDFTGSNLSIASTGTIATLNSSTATIEDLSVNNRALIIDLLTLGKQRVTTLGPDESGNINLMRLNPYRHTGGPWYINSLDTSSYAYFRILYDDIESFKLRHDGYLWVTRLYGAVWNDYAEYRESNEIEPGRVVLEDENGVCQKTIKRLQPFAGVISDTYGFAQGETEEAKTPLAVAGRVLVYPYQDRNKYRVGDCVCAAPNGTVDIMTRREVIIYPDRIVGTVSQVPKYDTWGTDNVKVNNRIWIKVR